MKNSDGDVVDHIFVCWEDLPYVEEFPYEYIDDAYANERKWVREAVANSWASESPIEFLGWQGCADKSVGIRIKIEDEQPHTKGLGSQIDRKAAGMVLNFTFQNWI